MSLADVRQDLADALSGVTGVSIYAYPHEVNSPPAIVVEANDPWLTERTIGGAFTVNLVLKLCVGATDNRAALELIETMAERVYSVLPDHFRPQSLSAPLQAQSGVTPLYVSEIPVSATITL